MLKLCAPLVLLLANQVALGAGPTSAEPDNVLPAARETSAELMLEVDLLVRQAREELERYEKNLAEGKYKNAELRVAGDISKTYIKIERLGRVAERLVLEAEPTGAELRLRVADLRHRCEKLINTYRDLPEGPPMVLKIGSAVPRLSASKKNALKAIGTLFKQDKVEQAQKRLDESVYDELNEVLCWLPSEIGLRTLAPFSDAKTQIDNRRSADLKMTTEQALVQLRADNEPQFKQFLAEVPTAIESVKAQGVADWRGKSLTGPALLEAWVAEWRAILVRVQHCRAIDWARGIKQGIRPPSELDQLEQAYSDFEAKLIAAMGQLIDADTARVIPDGVEQVYTSYVDVIAEVASQITSETWLPTVAGALDKLRDKSPQLARQVDLYGKATNEVLRWRRRAADAAERGRRASLVELEVLWAKGDDPKAMVARDKSRSKPALTYLSSGAPVLLRDLSSATLSQAARVTNIAPSQAGGAISRYRQRLMAHMAAGQLPDAEINRLRTDLLVDEKSPPLTLAAAIGLRSAEQGYLQSAAGEATGLELQAMITHFLRLDENSPHIPLGPFALEPPQDDHSPLLQVMYVYDLKPAWLRHEYIFSSVP